MEVVKNTLKIINIYLTIIKYLKRNVYYKDSSIFSIYSLQKQLDENESMACVGDGGGANSEKNNASDDWIIILFKYQAALIALPTTWFLIVITLLREHLFVWTVFSPKMLYDIYGSSLMFLLMTAVYLITFR